MLFNDAFDPARDTTRPERTPPVRGVPTIFDPAGATREPSRTASRADTELARFVGRYGPFARYIP
ncbi:hypothetical protein SAOR_11365 [Salinisphaera orenii MK-B5]|uniref:Uncharacterized protein n=1 Tax=Salinisphaera orenii MK-B5 TaxID=856730 RepID=A0A423PL33_9GAMM|nr:hypothetical protein [Salinisphaera orenii]ROO26324.1 hypothetical protein SAOR_11365 [Salinisphaera orenii MK-B5]